jgi:transposase-like protein
VRGKRRRAAGGKTIVFGLLKRDGRVYTETVPVCEKATLQAIIRRRVAPEVVINSDGWRGYDRLVDAGQAKHFRVNHGRSEFVRGAHRVNGIESFRSYAKHRLRQFHGIAPEKFYWHLKVREHKVQFEKEQCVC